MKFRPALWLMMALLTACATAPEKKEASATATVADEYEDYAPTGSHISNRVSKKQLKSSDEKKAYDETLMQKMQQEQPDPQGPLPH